jgi:hypothetical protein
MFPKIREAGYYVGFSEESRLEVNGNSLLTCRITWWSATQSEKTLYHSTPSSPFQKLAMVSQSRALLLTKAQANMEFEAMCVEECKSILADFSVSILGILRLNDEVLFPTSTLCLYPPTPSPHTHFRIGSFPAAVSASSSSFSTTFPLSRSTPGHENVTTGASWPQALVSQ